MTAEDVAVALDALCVERGAEFGIELVVASQCCWSAEIRVTPKPNDADGPDRSYVVFTGGHLTADDAAVAAFVDMGAWLEDLPKLERVSPA